MFEWDVEHPVDVLLNSDSHDADSHVWSIYIENNCRFKYPSCSILVDEKWDSHCMCYGPYKTGTVKEGDRGHPWWCPVCVGAPDEDACREHYSVTLNLGTDVGWREPVLPVNDTYYRNKDFCKLSPLNGDCRSEEDCESGLICDSEGFCMNAECSGNDDCDGGFCVEGICLTGQESSRCSPLVQSCVLPLVCVNSYANGYVCSSGSISPTPDETPAPTASSQPFAEFEVAFTFDVRLNASPTAAQREVLKDILYAAIDPVLLPTPGRLLRGRAGIRNLASIVGGDLNLSTNPSNTPMVVNMTLTFSVNPNPEPPTPVKDRVERALESIRSKLLNAFSAQPTSAPSPSSISNPIQTTNNSSNDTTIYIAAGVAAVLAAMVAFCLAMLCRRRKKTKLKERMRRDIFECLKDVAPEQVVNFDSIMVQFDGKEEELLEQLKCLQVDPNGYKLEVLSPVAADNASTSSSSSGGFIFTSSKKVLENTKLGGLDVVEVEVNDDSGELNLGDLGYIESSRSIDGDTDAPDPQEDASVTSSHAWAMAASTSTTVNKLAECLDDVFADNDDNDDSRDSDYVPVKICCASSVTSSHSSDDGSATAKSVRSVCFAPSPDKSYKENLPVKIKSALILMEGSPDKVHEGIEAVAEERLRMLEEKDKVIAKKDKALRELSSILNSAQQGQGQQQQWH